MQMARRARWARPCFALLSSCLLFGCLADRSISSERLFAKPESQVITPPPSWVLAGLEKPAGRKDEGTWYSAFYTPEQQERLGVDEHGNSVTTLASTTAPVLTTTTASTTVLVPTTTLVQNALLLRNKQEPPRHLVTVHLSRATTGGLPGPQLSTSVIRHKECAKRPFPAPPIAAKDIEQYFQWFDEDRDKGLDFMETLFCAQQVRGIMPIPLEFQRQLLASMQSFEKNQSQELENDEFHAWFEAVLKGREPGISDQGACAGAADHSG